ncbi:MAG: SpoIIIAH-like family protein [Oscillospiraceae bacterium]|nr:SpoIIIAH-like family protein [Oscillospiraceae bacterium]
MKIWKKNLIAAAILITVCGGIYVNWLYTENQNVASLTDTLNEDKILSEDMIVINDIQEFNNEDTMTSYFAAVRLSRQEARDSAVGLLQEAMAYSENADTAETNAQLEELVQTALCEAQIESLVIAKGYTDCVAYITDGGVSVAVASPEQGFTQTDAAIVADIVMTQANCSFEDIRIVEVH